MKTTDLRIGNQFIEKYTKTIISVIVITEKSTTFTGDFKDKWQVKPIKLTEEYLLRLGLEQKKHGYFKYINGCDILFFSLEKKCIEINFMILDFVKVQHVHELQNIIYHLTGIELTIYPTAAEILERGYTKRGVKEREQKNADCRKDNLSVDKEVLRNIFYNDINENVHEALSGDTTIGKMVGVENILKYDKFDLLKVTADKIKSSPHELIGYSVGFTGDGWLKPRPIIAVICLNEDDFMNYEKSSEFNYLKVENLYDIGFESYDDVFPLHQLRGVEFIKIQWTKYAKDNIHFNTLHDLCKTRLK